MNLESIRQSLCNLVEGGPGSGRYPVGSGKNPDAHASRPRTNTANKNQGSNWIRRTTRVKLYKRDGWKCRYCAKRVTQGGPLKSRATLDHLDANHKNNDHNNLATVCYSCNSSRKNASEEDFKKSIGLAAGLELGKETFMNFDAVKKFVDEFVESLFEGGPGSGRYPAGTGKKPTLDDNVGGSSAKELSPPAQQLVKMANNESELAKKYGSPNSHANAFTAHRAAAEEYADVNDKVNAAKHSALADHHNAEYVRLKKEDSEARTQAAKEDALGTSKEEPLLKPAPHDAKDRDLLRPAIDREIAASHEREKSPAKVKPVDQADSRAGSEPHKHSHSEKADRIVNELKGNKKIRVIFNQNDNSIEIRGGDKRAFIRYRNQTAKDAEKLYDELGKRVGGKKSLTLAHTEPLAKSEARYRRKLSKFGLRSGE